MARSGRWGSIARRFAAVAFGIALALAAAEIGLRVAGVSHPTFDMYDPVRGVALRPGVRGWYRKEGAALVEINQLGYRDVDHARRKPPGVIRIAFLGDSFTEARQVPIEATYWKQVEQRLDRDPRLAGARVEALSFGVGGYSTAQELLTLRQHVLDFAPDVVVVAMFLANDIAENSRPISIGLNDAQRPFFVRRDGELVLDDRFRDPTAAQLLHRLLLAATHHSRLFEVLNQWRRQREIRRRQERLARPPHLIGTYDQIYAPPPDDTWAEAWSITEALLVQIAAQTDRAGARFVLLTLTTEAQVDLDRERRARLQRSLGVDDLFYAEQRLRALGTAHGFTVITLAEPMQAEADRRQVLFHGFANAVMGFGHWNADGHATAARILAERLIDSGVLAAHPEHAARRGIRTGA